MRKGSEHRIAGGLRSSFIVSAMASAAGLCLAANSARASTLAYEWPLDGSLAATTGGNDLQAQTSTYTSYQSSFTTGVTANDSYSSSVPAALAGNGYANSVSLSGITNDGTGTNGMSTNTAGYGYAQGALVSTSNVSFSSSTSYSISVWVNTANLSNTGSNYYLVNLGEYDTSDKAGEPGNVGLRDNKGILQLDEQVSGTESENYFGAALSSTLNGTWVNIVASIDNTAGTAVLYVNGQTFATSTIAADELQGTWVKSAVGADPVMLGWRYAPYNGYPGGPYTGLISDVQIYDGALTQSDAEAIYTTGSAVPEPASAALLGLGAAALLSRRRKTSNPSDK